MTDLRRSPVPGIFRGLRMFVFAYSISLLICGFIGKAAYIETSFVPLLLLSVSFAVVFPCTEMIRSNIAAFIITIVCAALSLFLSPGIIPGSKTATDVSALPYVICIILLVVIAVAYRASMDKVSFNSTTLVTHILLLFLISFIGGFMDNTLLRIILYYAAIAYIPLSVGNLFAETVYDAFDRMRGKTTQPIALFKRRVFSSCAKVIILLSAFLLLLPSVDFSFMKKVYGAMFLYFFKFLSWLSCAPLNDGVQNTEGDPYIATSTGSTDGRLADIIGYICVGIICLCALEVLRRLIVKLVRILRDYFSTAHERTEKTKAVAAGKFDTIEQLERTETRKKREKLTPAQTYAQKVRRIYKKRVESLLKTELGDLSSKAPDEITELAREHGYDISELTRIYKKARYSDNCTAQDVSSAKKTKVAAL